MDLKMVKQMIRKHLTNERYEHSLRVAEVAKQLAKIHQVNERDVELAALFHDIAKDQTTAELTENIKKYRLPKELLSEHKELWHGPVGAKIVQQIYQVQSEAIYQAIYYHTTGRAGMGDLELIIYIADYIEPERQIPGVADVRKLAQNNLIEAALLIASRTIKYLLDKRVTIHINTFLAYNDLLKRLTNH